MKVEYDEKKRARTLKKRGLDFEDAVSVCNSAKCIAWIDTREDYGEERVIQWDCLPVATLSLSPHYEGQKR